MIVFTKQEDIFYYVSKELNLPEGLIKKVIQDFWNTIRVYLTNPLLTKKGILLHGFGLFFIKPYTLERKIEYFKDNEEKLTFHQNLLNNINES